MTKEVLWVSLQPAPKLDGCQVTAVTSGKAAVKLWPNTKQQLVFIDRGVLADGLSGYDVVRHLRELSPTVALYVTMLSIVPTDEVWAKRNSATGVVLRTPKALGAVVSAFKPKILIAPPAVVVQKTESLKGTATLYEPIVPANSRNERLEGQKIAAALTPYLGPVASIVFQSELTANAGVVDHGFVAILASHIGDAADRREFMALFS